MITNKSPNRIQWTTKHDDALKTIQNVLNTPPVLRIPDLCLKFHLFADCSDISLASSPCQYIDGRYHPTKYHSAKLTPAQQKWSIAERECFAFISAIKKWDRYLLGNHFFIHSDHRGLSVITSKNKPQNKRIYRWSLMLSEYNYTLLHVAGNKNLLADYLSRNPECLLD